MISVYLLLDYIYLDPLKYIQFRFLRTWFIPKRVYQNNAAVILHLIKYIVTTWRMFKHQNTAVKHFEDSVQHFAAIRIVCRFLLQTIGAISI